MHPSSFVRVLCMLCMLGCSSIGIGTGGGTGSGSCNGSDSGSGSGSGGGSDGGSDAPAVGRIQLSWTLAIRGQAAPCERVGAVAVLMRLHPRAGNDLRFVFACTDGGAISAAITAGPYDVALSLIAADGSLFGVAPVQHATVDAEHITSVEPFAFDVADDTGHLVLSLASLGIMSHCAAQPDGAGITSHVLTVRGVDGRCAPVTFTRVRGGQPIGTYTVNCAVPVVGPCIERDETLILDGLTSGPYAILVSGLTSETHQLCWHGEDALVIPAGGSLTKTVQLARVGGQGC